MKTIADVPLILRRRIEAEMAAPFVDALERELGEQRAREIVKEIISASALAAGEHLSREFDVHTPGDIKEKVVPMFEAGGALESDYKETTEKRVVWDVKYCAYAEMYRTMGRPDLGGQLSCQRDEYLFKGINKDIRFTRTKTLMEGGDCCDFCLELDTAE